jgi:hypothetical protein
VQEWFSHVEVPTMVASAWSTRETIVVSIGEMGYFPSGDVSCENVPTVKGRLPTDMLSLMAIVRPCKVFEEGFSATRFVR